MYSRVAVRACGLLWVLKSEGRYTSIVDSVRAFLVGDNYDELSLDMMMSWYRLQSDDDMKMQCIARAKEIES